MNYVEIKEFAKEREAKKYAREMMEALKMALPKASISVKFRPVPKEE